MGNKGSNRDRDRTELRLLLQIPHGYTSPCGVRRRYSPFHALTTNLAGPAKAPTTAITGPDQYDTLTHAWAYCSGRPAISPQAWQSCARGDIPLSIRYVVQENQCMDVVRFLSACFFLVHKDFKFST